MDFRRFLEPRPLTAVFAVFAGVAGALVGLRPDAPHPFFQSAGTVGYALAAVVSLACWAAFARPAFASRARKTLIVFHLVFIPSQFLFLLAHDVAWPGMALSTLLTVALRPRFPRLGRFGRRVWVTLHVGISVGWLGLSLAMLTLAIIGATTGDHAIRHGAYEIMHAFNIAIVIPSVFLAIITGAVVSLGTPWGLVKHWWVLLKLVIALSLPVLATFESTWIERLAAGTADPAFEPGGTGVLLAIFMGLFLALLWTATVLSVFKPGGRTPWERRKSKGPKSIPVTVTAVRAEADRVAALELAGAGPLPAWEPGAHIDLVLPSGRVRQYSLCGDPSAPAYRIAVLHEPDGRGGSAEVHSLKEGAAVAIRGPRNHFRLVDAPSYLFVAGGIGIAPFVPMVAELERRGADWRLVYRGQSSAAMAFARSLTAAYPDRVVLSPADASPRPDLEALLRAAPPRTAVYCCGPASMLAAVEALMPTACPHGRLHVERFAARERETGPDTPFEAELRASRTVVRVPADRTLLAALQDVDPTLDFSCEDGVCGSCETRVLDGVPDHRDDILSGEDRARRDVIYPCVSRARGSRIVLDL